MNKTVRKLWTTALRSGSYLQTVGYLHVEGGTLGLQPGYCCLGVLCEIAALNGKVRATYSDRSGVWAYGADTETGILPAEVVAWAGLDSDDPMLPAPAYLPVWDEKPTALTTMNDDCPLTFFQIADLIEQHL